MVTKILGLLFMCTVALAYTDVDDTLNVDELVKDGPALRKHMDCFLDRQPCTDQDAHYSSHMYQIVRDGCRECNDVEKHMFRVFIDGLKKKLPQDYDAFKAKYDPTNTYFDAAINQVKKY